MKTLKPYHELFVLNRKMDKQEIHIVLSELTSLLEMKAMMKPIVLEGTSLKGYSGIIMIETSHIALHSFDDYNKTWLDILSCKSFDVKKVKNYFKSLCKPQFDGSYGGTYF